MEDIDWKQEALLENSEKLRSFIKVRPDGKINEKDYNFLEIALSSNKKEYKNQEFRQNELKKRIYSFVS